MQVRELTMSHIPEGMSPSEHERRSRILYLVLISYYEDDEDEEPRKVWDYCRGTQTAYDYIADIIKSTDECNKNVDLNNSYILVASPKVTIDNPLPLYNFLRDCIDKKKVVSNGFDIDEYYDSEYDDYEEVGEEEHEARYGQGDNPSQYTSQESVDGGEV